MILKKSPFWLWLGLASLALIADDVPTASTSPTDPALSSAESMASTGAADSFLKQAPVTDAERMAALDDKKVINSGDLLSFTIRQDREGPQVVLVDEQGLVSIPYAGPIVAKGKTCKALAYEIKDKLEKSFYQQATILIGPATQEGTRGRIFVLGQVANPGPLKIPTDEILTVSRAILQAGILQSADLTRVSIVRKDPQSPSKDLKMDVNVSEVINNGRFDQDVIVRANDLIFVPTQGASVGEVLMTGAIRQPGPLPIPIGGKFMLTDAIFRAGGFAEFADKERVKIVRKDATAKEGKNTIIVNVSKILDQGRRELDQILENQDVVIVPEKWFNF